MTLPAYGLEVVTKNVGWGGTDANITFRLEGTRALATKIVSGSPRGRFEAGGSAYVSIQGVDVGVLKAITVSRDDSGSAPSWCIEAIGVSSRETGGVLHWVRFDQWLSVPHERARRAFPLRGAMAFGQSHHQLRLQ